jgi:hypothetical protein
MFTQSQQTSTLKVARWPRSLRFGLMAVSLIVALAIAGLFIGLNWSRNLALYPGAERQATTQFHLRLQPTGILTQEGAYQTPDDLPQVLGWYAQHFGLDHDMPQGDTCVTMTRADSYLFLQQSLAVTLCAHPTRTLIFIDRSLALR